MENKISEHWELVTWMYYALGLHGFGIFFFFFADCDLKVPGLLCLFVGLHKFGQNVVLIYQYGYLKKIHNNYYYHYSYYCKIK